MGDHIKQNQIINEISIKLIALIANILFNPDNGHLKVIVKTFDKTKNIMFDGQLCLGNRFTEDYVPDFKSSKKICVDSKMYSFLQGIILVFL